jgi:transposase
VNQPPLPLDLPEPQPVPAVAPAPPALPRVLRPVRNQVQWIERDLDSLVAEDHPVRAVWEAVQRLDLGSFYARIKATLERPGHPATDPAILLAVWVYATSEGVGSARRLARLCAEHDAYRWLCGGVPTNDHTLADLRTAYPAELDRLLTEIVALLLAAELVTLKQGAQDGVRVRASAGSGSFHRQKHLEACLAEAREQVERLAQEREHPDPQVSAREEKARQRAARERTERLTAALEQLPALQEAKERQKRTLIKPRREKITEARASATDPDARVMKMPDGGFRPAYNVEVATDVASGIIVGVDVVNQGSDARQATPMEQQVVQRTGRHPDAYLLDGGFAQRDEITTLTERGVTVYAPTRPPRTTTSGRTPDMARPDDSPAVVAWRERMETDAAKTIYRQRAATSEWVNAQLRQHGLPCFRVRGLPTVRTRALLVVLTPNLLRWIAWAA